MKRKVLSIVFSLALLLSLGLFTAAPAAAAATYYVATTGLDSNPGSEASPWLTIQHAVDVAVAGDTINVAAGTYVEVGQIVISKNLSIVGADRATTIIKPNANTGSSGDAKGWWLVNQDITFNLSGVTLDGDGKMIFHGIRDKGHGTIQDVYFTKITYNASTDYAGFAIYAFSMTGAVNVSDCVFDNIGREGIAYWGPGTTGTYSGNTYTGKGLGDWLDYGVEVNNGAVVTITGSTFTNCRGTATLDGSKSAGIAVLTVSGPGTQATITGNTFTGNSFGIGVGANSNDTSVVHAHGNCISGNVEFGVETASSTVVFDAEDNWWGNASGPHNATSNPSGTGDNVSDNVDFSPYQATGCNTGGGGDGDLGGKFDTCNAPVVTVTFASAAMNPMSQQMATVHVNMGEGATLADLTNIVFKVWYDANGGTTDRTEFDAKTTGDAQTCAIITWTNAGDTWVGQPSGTTWDFTGSSRPGTEVQQGDFIFRFTPGKVATATEGAARWQIAATATRPDPCGSGFDSDNEGADMNWYGELSVATASVDWGTVLPGMDFDNAVADQSVGTITYISNGGFDKKAKTDSTWEHGSVLDATGACDTAQEFALRADDDATLADAVLLNTTGAGFGTGALTIEAGSPDETNTLWLKLASSFTEYTYSGTVTYIIAND